MSKTELLIRLRDLHGELSGINDDLKVSEQIDDETVEALGQLATDVAELVDHANELKIDQVVVETQRDLMDQIGSFEARHPRVTAFLSQLMDLLAMLGI